MFRRRMLRKMYVILLLTIILQLARSDCDCGCRTGTRSRRIAGGAEPDEIWPWMAHFVHVQKVKEESNKTVTFSCGASIIGAKWALTSAHCLDGMNCTIHKCVLIAGLKHYTPPYNYTITQRTQELEFYIHPAYGIPLNDIALIEITSSFNLTPTVQPICLAKNSEHIYASDARLQQIGFGDLVHYNASICGMKSQPPELVSAARNVNKTVHELHVRAIRAENCKQDARAHLLGYFPRELVDQFDSVFDQAAEQLVCTHSRAPLTGSCHGDSGSPLLAQARDAKDERWFQHGVFMATMGGCGDPTSPHFYTKVAGFCEFIEQTTHGEVTCKDPAMCGACPVAERTKRAYDLLEELEAEWGGDQLDDLHREEEEQ